MAKSESASGTMRVWQCDATRPVPGLVPAEMPIPCPGTGEVLIRVHAVGVTPTELLWYPTIHTMSGDSRERAVPGHEFSGVIAATGPAARAEIGQAVFGMNDWFAEGAAAEYCCAPISGVVAKPDRLSHGEAASVPISALTAWQGLFDKARLQAGDKVLIHGGAGAVGMFALQLAHRRRSTVITTAAGRHQQFLKQLGADEVIDYRTERFEDLAGEFDVIFDTVGGETLQRSWKLLKADGRMVTVAASGEVATDARTQQAFFIVEPHLQQLQHIADLLERGELQAIVDREVSFEMLGRAWSTPQKGPRGCGKTVVRVLS